MLHYIPMLSAEHAGKDEVLEYISFALGFRNCGINQVKADFIFEGVQAGQNGVDGGSAMKEFDAVGEGLEVDGHNFGIRVLSLQFVG
jgi:hypothetical protein